MLPTKPVVDAPIAHVGMGTLAQEFPARPAATPAPKPKPVTSPAAQVQPVSKVYTFVKATDPGMGLLIDGEIRRFPLTRLNSGGFASAATWRTSDAILAGKLREYAAKNPTANITEV